VAELPTLVILAGGVGSRFGGLKQLAEIRSDGAAIMDFLLERAARAGFERAIVVVAPATEHLVGAHLDAMRGSVFPADFPVELAVQRAVPGRTKPLGTADAVLATRAAVEGSFAVVNADDLYPAAAFGAIASHLRRGPGDEHAAVAFPVAATLTEARPVSRALIEVDASGTLTSIREGRVLTEADGLRFEAGTFTTRLADDALVSMNMWGFRPSVFDALARAVPAFRASPVEGEVFLTDVVGSMVESGAVVRVIVSEGACPGVTYPDDLAAVQRALT
jgi:dTDP-glucose pyrophosphorylase